MEKRHGWKIKRSNSFLVNPCSNYHNAQRQLKWGVSPIKHLQTDDLQDNFSGVITFALYC